MSFSAEYRRIRRVTMGLIEPLGAEDCQVQTMADVSPPKWHLAHTTWFFETFVLEPHAPGYRCPAPAYKELFNSYYEAVGPRHPRPQRGHLSRPTLAEVIDYRRWVDDAMSRVLDAPGALAPPIAALVELGLHHEQQHQELLVMDVKYNFGQNPLLPAYRREPLPSAGERSSEPGDDDAFVAFEPGLVSIGALEPGFRFDNEEPVHRRFLEPFALARRLVTNREWLAFVEAGGYRTPSLWLSDGFAWVREHGVESPLYWRRGADGAWYELTAHGEVALELDAPVCHVSGYEAHAFASFAGARLPTEAEWEVAARSAAPSEPRALEDGCWHPRPASAPGLAQLYGDVWQWTRSAYEPYPGYQPTAGALGEYNGKFMSGQWVLRGGSAITPRGHTRPSYRNFFYPHQRWPFTGVRLARDARAHRTR